MFSPLRPQGLKSFLIGLGCCFAAAMSASAANHDVTLDEQSMAQAIGYMSMLRGRDISAEDGAWLKQQWGEEFKASPATVAAEVDQLASLLAYLQQHPDPMALADSRTTMVKNIYCAAQQSSAPLQQRLRDILAPDDLVLASDCLLGFVVTRFDVDGLVASHELTAEATGQEHDAARDRTEIIDIIADGFAEAAPADKALIANGELRQAVLARFWSRIDGSAEQRAVIDEVRSAAATDLRGTARQLEKLALSKLGEVDYLAKVGDAKLTTAAINSYNQWLERLAGYSLSVRDRLWLQQAIVREFQADPAKTLGEVAGIRDMNSAYLRSDSVSEKNGLAAGWAANLFCYLNTSSDPDEIRLADVIFRQDPVVDTDCQAGRITRERDAVLAEVSGQRLTERDVGASAQFASILIGRPLMPEEEAIIRNDNIDSFKEDLASWREEHEFILGFLGKIEKRVDSRFLAIDERKKLFDAIYCSLKDSDDTYADDYVKMFQRGDAILFEDCDRQLVTTRDEIDAIVSFANFLTLLNGKPPLSQADEEELRQSLMSENMDGAESSMSAVNEWWSLLSLEEKVAEVGKIREKGIALEADRDTIAAFINTVKLTVVTTNARIKSCMMLATVIQGQTAIFAASQGPHTVTPSNPSGISGGQLAGLVSSSNLAAEVCKGVNAG